MRHSRNIFSVSSRAGKFDGYFIGYPIIDSDQGHQKRERSGSEGKGRRGEERRV
jgi:hypothetical protein